MGLRFCSIRTLFQMIVMCPPSIVVGQTVRRCCSIIATCFLHFYQLFGSHGPQFDQWFNIQGRRRSRSRTVAYCHLRSRLHVSAELLWNYWVNSSLLSTSTRLKSDLGAETTENDSNYCKNRNLLLPWPGTKISKMQPSLCCRILFLGFELFIFGLFLLRCFHSSTTFCNELRSFSTMCISVSSDFLSS